MSGFGVGIVSFIVAIGVLVFVHELGHFLAAKWAGIHVHRFSLGLGAPIRWLSFRKGETEYSVSWLPLGGYVKMATRMEDAGSAIEGGDAAENAEVDPDRMFEAKPVWVRMVVILAGVTMNALFAWLIFTGLILSRGTPVLATTTVAGVDSAALPAGAAALTSLASGDRIVSVAGKPVATWKEIREAWTAAPGGAVTLELAGRAPISVTAAGDDRDKAIAALRPFIPPVIGELIPDRAGEKAGLLVGDTVVTFDGTPVREWTEMVSLVSAAADREIAIEVGRAGGRRIIRATPQPEQVADSAGVRQTVGRLGIGPDVPQIREPVGLLAAAGTGARRTGAVALSIVGLVRGMFTGEVSTRELGGPIAIGMAARQSVEMGAEVFLGFLALMSVNLAVLNLLPIPILDGGQFLFLLAEGVTRRPVTGRIREWLTMAGLVAIVMLMVLAFSNDIRRWLGI